MTVETLQAKLPTRPPIEQVIRAYDMHGSLMRDLALYALELERRAAALLAAATDLEGTPVEYRCAIHLAKATNELRALLPAREGHD